MPIKRIAISLKIALPGKSPELGIHLAIEEGFGEAYTENGKLL